MPFISEFIPLPLDQLRREAAVRKADGWRFVQTHAVNTDAGVDLYYSFMKDGNLLNYRVEGVAPDTPVPSITDLFLAAFVFENEARELFGVDMRDIALDFQGAMYAPAEAAPMTFISPEQKAAREKAKKVAAAKAAKAGRIDASGGEDGQSAGTAPGPGASGKRVFVMTPDLQARLDAKMPTLSEEKKAKVAAALKARAAEAEAAGDGAGGGVPGESACSAKTQGRPQRQGAELRVAGESEGAIDAILESKLADMAPEKAAKVRMALEGKAAASGSAGSGPAGSSTGLVADEQVAKLLSTMDEAKASRVIAVLAAEGGE